MSLDAIKFDATGAIDAKALVQSHPHAVEHCMVGGKVTASVPDPSKLLAVVIREVQGLRQQKAVAPDEVDALRKQVSALARRIEALEHGLDMLEKRPAPVAPQSQAAQITPSQELVLHLKANTKLSITSHLKDGIRQATFKLD